MVVSVLPSDPDAEVFAFLAYAIAAWTNAHMFADLRQVPEAERLAEIAYYKQLFEELSH